MKFENGDSIEGHWRDGKQSGESKFSRENGDFYRGNWINGSLQGQGAYILHDGNSGVSRYEGYFFENLEQGYGLKIGFDGSKYDGQFR